MKLNSNEELVLFDFLSREIDNFKIEHYAESKLLNSILADLEKKLSEPFAKNYKELVEKARANIQGDDDPT